MSKFNYQRYLASREWGLLKRQVRERSGGNCERGHVEPVPGTSVHHTTYERIGHEELADLLHVCGPCHEFLSGDTDVDPVEFTEDSWRDSPFAARILADQILIALAYEPDDLPPKTKEFDEFVEAFSKASGIPAAIIRDEVTQRRNYTPPRGRRLP